MILSYHKLIVTNLFNFVCAMECSILRKMPNATYANFGGESDKFFSKSRICMLVIVKLRFMYLLSIKVTSLMSM